MERDQICRTEELKLCMVHNNPSQFPDPAIICVSNSRAVRARTALMGRHKPLWVP